MFQRGKEQYTRDDHEKIVGEKGPEAIEEMAFGVKIVDVQDLSPEDITVTSLGDMENPESKFEIEGMGWARSEDLSEPVEMAIDKDGNYDLKDGHHRWLAAQKTDRPLKAKVDEIRANSINVILDKQAQRAGSPSLRATHTLSTQNLQAAIERGRFTAPSVAVQSANVPHQWGGEDSVDVIFRSEAIDPARDNLAAGDAATPFHALILRRHTGTHADRVGIERQFQSDVESIPPRLRRQWTNSVRDGLWSCSV